MNVHRKLVFLVGLFLLACGVKQPVENLDQKEVTGHLFVNSDPPGAAIILDGQATGLLTPDTLKNISVGKHIVRVFLSGYQAQQDSFVVEVQQNQVANILFQLQKIITTVTLNVESDPPGATIFLDDQNTGKTTPDTLVTEPGDHRIKLVKNGFVVKDSLLNLGQQAQFSLNVKLPIVQRVLFESFANVSCIPCVAATENLLRFTTEHDEDSFVIIEYFANWPNPNDPFYKQAPRDVDARVAHYGVQTLPTLKLQGSTGVAPSSYDEIVTKFEQAIDAQNAALGISIDKQLVEGQLKVKVELFDYGNITTQSDLRLFVAITEDSIHFNSPPGSNGLKDFEWVFRGFLTDRQGQELTQNTFTFEIPWPANWQYAHSKIVAFIQNINTKQIIQTGIY